MTKGNHATDGHSSYECGIRATVAQSENGKGRRSTRIAGNSVPDLACDSKEVSAQDSLDRIGRVAEVHEG